MAIARSLANGPAVLLADEPTGNLDSENARLILELIVRIHREQNMTLVLVTHDLSIAPPASRTIQMKDGRIVSDRESTIAGHDMTFFTVVTRGLIRRPVRTGLTILGISVGIAAVVALVGISRGFSKSWETGMKARGTDVVVSDMGSSLIPKPFYASVRDRIAHLPHVAATCGILVDLMSVESAQMIMVSAREWGGFSWNNLKLISGRMPRDASEPAVVLGRTAAEVLKKKVGDKIQIETGELSVVGIVDGNAWVENGSVILALPVFQEITGNQGKINIIDIRVTPSTSAKKWTVSVKRLTSWFRKVAPCWPAITSAKAKAIASCRR